MTALANKVIIDKEDEIIPSGSEFHNYFSRKWLTSRGDVILTVANSSSTVLAFISSMKKSVSDNSKNFINRVLSFKELPENWDGYGASKVTEKTISNAVDFIYKLAAYDKQIYFVAPGPNGEVLVELKEQNRSAEVYLHDDGSDEVILLGNNETVFEGSAFQNFNKIIRFISIGEIA